MSHTDIYVGLTQLGSAARLPRRPKGAVLERVSKGWALLAALPVVHRLRKRDRRMGIEAQ